MGMSQLKKQQFPKEFAHEHQSEFMSIDEARHYSGGESKSSIYRALAAGELDAVKRGRRTLVTTESIRRRLRNLPKATFGLLTTAGISTEESEGASS